MTRAEPYGEGDLRDTMWDGTVLGWAEHGRHADITQYLRHVPPHF